MIKNQVFTGPFKWIVIISILIPLVITALMLIPGESKSANGWILNLPHLHGIINTLTSLVLIAGLVFIKNNYTQYHRYAMLTAFGLGIIFLISYVIYHANAPSTIFGDINGDGTLSTAEAQQVNWTRPLYITLLLSHILLSVVVVPLVLLALYYALNQMLLKHKKIVKYAYPIWLYVSVTGVLVYLMIRPYY